MDVIINGVALNTGGYCPLQEKIMTNNTPFCSHQHHSQVDLVIGYPSFTMVYMVAYIHTYISSSKIKFNHPTKRLFP